MRAAAQMISYEIPLLMSVVGVVLLTGSLNLNDIVAAQENGWYIFVQPIGFVIFFIAAVAELNRIPFDLPESESELFLDIMWNIQVFAGRFSCCQSMCICSGCQR